ncbi:hypothetical protein ACLD9W_11850, partial [Neisseria sp. WLZKY-1]|uniref:hypothetical protein n=1 Tax=Neisseria sp. WLZKY-1 TaxID=3390377 RepID=UPI00397A4CE0
MRRRLNVCNRAQPIQKGRLKKPAKQVFSDGHFQTATFRRPLSDGHFQTATFRRPLSDGHF